MATLSVLALVLKDTGLEAFDPFSSFLKLRITTLSNRDLVLDLHAHVAADFFIRTKRE